MDAPSPLRIAPSALVDVADGALHVVTARGTFDLEAPGIDRIHTALAPHLQGTTDRAGLLAALPPAQRPTVDAYLDRLTDAGLFALPTAGVSSGQLADGRSVTVRTDLAAPRAEVTLTFCSPDAVLAELVRPADGVEYLIVAPEMPSAPTRQRVADWLQTHEASVARGTDAVAVFDLDGPCLTRVLTSAERPVPLDDIVRRSGIVRASERPALPLASVEARHVWAPGLAFTTAGIGFEDAHPRATRRARALLGCLAAGTPVDAIASVVGPTEAAVRQRLLEREAGRAPLHDERPLHVPTMPAGDRLTYLRTALALEGLTVGLTLGTGPAGVSVVRSGDRRWAAMDAEAAVEAALVDQLLTAYGDRSDTIGTLDDPLDAHEGAAVALAEALPSHRLHLVQIDEDTWIGTSPTS